MRPFLTGCDPCLARIDYCCCDLLLKVFLTVQPHPRLALGFSTDKTSPDSRSLGWSDCQKTRLGGSEGRSPPSCIPNPATCAVDSEALRSKVSLRRPPPGAAEGGVGGRRKPGGKDRRRRAFSTH